MSLTRQIRVVVPRLQQCLYTTGSSDSGSAGKTSKAIDKTKPKQTSPATPPPPQPSKVAPKQEQPSKLTAKQEPSDCSKYQCNTYYEHKEWTFYDIESQMASKRVGQPSPYDKKS